MELTLLYVWLIGHFLSDFYFQTDEMAELKKTNQRVMFRHNVIYLLTMLAVSLMVFHWTIFFVAIGISLTHALIDRMAIYIRNKNKEKSIQLYILDQFLHIGIILIAYVFVQERVNIAFVFKPIISMPELLRWILMLLIVVSPISVTIRTILEPYRPDADEKEGLKNAGALVGILERLIVFLLLSVNQYGAIGLVLTAKSIARYNRISEDPVFSEYYLLGTLLSMLLVIAPYLLIF